MLGGNEIENLTSQRLYNLAAPLLYETIIADDLPKLLYIAPVPSAHDPDAEIIAHKEQLLALCKHLYLEPWRRLYGHDALGDGQAYKKEYSALSQSASSLWQAYQDIRMQGLASRLPNLDTLSIAAFTVGREELVATANQWFWTETCERLYRAWYDLIETSVATTSCSNANRYYPFDGMIGAPQRGTKFYKWPIAPMGTGRCGALRTHYVHYTAASDVMRVGIYPNTKMVFLYEYDGALSTANSTSAQTLAQHLQAIGWAVERELRDFRIASARRDGGIYDPVWVDVEFRLPRHAFRSAGSIAETGAADDGVLEDEGSLAARELAVIRDWYQGKPVPHWRVQDEWCIRIVDKLHCPVCEGHTVCDAAEQPSHAVEHRVTVVPSHAGYRNR